MSTAEERNDERFKSHLVKSEEARGKMARKLTELGYPVLFPPAPILDRAYKDRLAYTDDGDLHLLLRVEVKERGFVFTKREDWRYPDFAVCAKHAWDLAKEKPHLFIVLSACGEYAGVVYGKHWERWIVRIMGDPRYEGRLEQKQYCSPLEWVKFIKISELPVFLGSRC